MHADRPLAMYYTYLESPVGPFLVAGDSSALAITSFSTGHQHRRPGSDWIDDRRPLEFAIRQLDEYFAGERSAFDLPLRIVGTPFQKEVWEALRDVPFGETASYGQIARAIGRPNASRAVGAANGANVLPIIIPCHRIIGADGSLTGFGGGLETKVFLLAHEGSLPEQQTELF